MPLTVGEIVDLPLDDRIAPSLVDERGPTAADEEQPLDESAQEALLRAEGLYKWAEVVAGEEGSGDQLPPCLSFPGGVARPRSGSARRARLRGAAQTAGT